MGDDVIGTLASLTLSAWSRQQSGKAKLEQYQQGLIHAMKKAGKKSMEYHGFTLERVAAPMVQCRSCFHALAPVPGIDPNHKAEYIKITSNKQRAEE